jgi:hypothetical protein
MRPPCQRHHPAGGDDQVDVFILEPDTGRYLGRLCDFNACPQGKPACLVPGCGAMPFLRQHEDFRWRPEAMAPDRSLCLFERATGRVCRAVDLPLPTGEEDADAARPR